MFVLEPLTASALMILASNKAMPACVMPSPVSINVIPKTKDIEYDYKKSLKDIQKLTATANTPNDNMHSLSITQGFAQQQVKTTSNLKFAHKVINRKGDRCLWYESINMTIEIDPKIVIARELKRDRCMGPVILEHETEHINIDRRVVNETAPIMAQAIYETMSEHGFVHGPIPAGEVKTTLDKMAKVVNAAIQKEYNVMGAKRSARQQAIDTPEEYARVNALCPDFHKRKKSLYERARVAKEREQKKLSKD